MGTRLVTLPTIEYFDANKSDTDKSCVLAASRGTCRAEGHKSEVLVMDELNDGPPACKGCGQQSSRQDNDGQQHHHDRRLRTRAPASLSHRLFSPKSAVQWSEWIEVVRNGTGQSAVAERGAVWTGVD